MAVPDNTYFGEKPEGGGIKYREVRLITEEQRKLEILKTRLDPLLIGQINELAYAADNTRKVYSPFPLTVLTLLSIETLGHIVNDVERIRKESEFEQSKILVTPVYQLMDRGLSHKPSKKFYRAFETLHGKKVKKLISKYSDIIHIYQRNTFNHGYQSRGVFLTEEIQKAIEINEEAGCLYLNPYLFWELFKKTYSSVFHKILEGSEAEWRKNALMYFQKLID